MDTIVKSSKLTDPSLPADYVEEFQEEAPEAEIQVTSVPTSELVKREKQVEEQRLATAQAEVKKFKAREADIAFREDKARQRVKEIEDEAANRLQRIQADADADNKLHESRIARYFLQSKVMLEEKVEAEWWRQGCTELWLTLCCSSLRSSVLAPRSSLLNPSSTHNRQC